MSVRQDLKYRARIVKAVTVAAGVATWSVPDPLPPFKPVALIDPARLPIGASSESPRNEPAYQMSWPENYKGLGLVQAGTQVECPGIGILELLGKPRGPQNGGYIVRAQLTSQLYPMSGMVEDQGGADVQACTLAMWDEDEIQERSTRYENFLAEAPIDYSGILTNQRQIRIGAKAYKITETNLDLGEPRVRLALRRVSDE